MFQNAKNSKRMQHVADTVQSLIEIGIKPKSIHFDERKTKVLLHSAPDTQGLGQSFRYSWGKDEQGQLFEMHMLPMRDINLIWKTYPKRQAILKSKQVRVGTENRRSLASRYDARETIADPTLRLSQIAGTTIAGDSITFGVAA